MMLQKNKMSNSEDNLPMPKGNYLFFILGIVLVLVGYLLMIGGGSDDPNTFNEQELFSFRRITLAPIVCLLGFGVIIYGIMKKPKQKKSEE